MNFKCDFLFKRFYHLYQWELKYAGHTEYQVNMSGHVETRPAIGSDRQERVRQLVCHHTLVLFLWAHSHWRGTTIHQIQINNTSILKNTDREHRPGPNQLFWALNIAFLISSHANIFPDTCYNGKTGLSLNLCGTHTCSRLAGSRCPIFCPDKFSIWHQLYDRKPGNRGLNTLCSYKQWYYPFMILIYNLVLALV